MLLHHVISHYILTCNIIQKSILLQYIISYYVMYSQMTSHVCMYIYIYIHRSVAGPQETAERQLSSSFSDCSNFQLHVSMLPLCYKSSFGVGRGPREGRGWGNSMLLMLGVVSQVMMLHDADMLLVRKIRVVLTRRRRFLPVCCAQSQKVPPEPHQQFPESPI